MTDEGTQAHIDALAAQVKELTAERDQARSICTGWMNRYNQSLEWQRELQAERDAARAELAAANTRCAELEAEYAEVPPFRCLTHKCGSCGGCKARNVDDENTRLMVKSADLKATLDRVTVLADEWQLCLRDPKRRRGWSGAAVLADLRRALADSGTKDGSNDE